MSDRREDPVTGAGGPVEPGADEVLVAADDEEPPVYVEAAKKVGRFSREFLATVIALLTTAFGVVVALAWNTALTKAVEESGLSEGDKVTSFFIYAIVITLLAVMVIVILGRLATRVGAEPIQFTYPVKPTASRD